jgi:hypothetical protein
MSPNEVFESEWSEMLDELKNDHNNQGNARKYWSPPSDKEGTFPIRILPPLKKKGEKLFYFQHKIHWIDGSPYECLDQELVDSRGNLHEAEECPICSMAKKLYKISERDSDEWKLANELRQQPRYVYRIIVRDPDNSEEEVNPKFYETGKKIYEIIFHILTESDYGVIIDYKNGRDMNIKKVGKGRRSNYDQSLPAANTSPLFKEPDKIKATIEKAMEMDYNSLVEFVSRQEIENTLKSYLSGGSKKSDSEQKQPEKQKVQKSAPAVQAKEEVEESQDDDEIDKLLDELDV